MIKRRQPLPATPACLAILAAALSLVSSCSAKGGQEITLKPVSGPVVLRRNLQVGNLQMIAGNRGAWVFWERVALMERGEHGIVSVTRDGRIAINQILPVADIAFAFLASGTSYPGKASGDRFTLFSQEKRAVYRRTFAIKPAGPRRPARTTPVGPPIAVSNRNGLVAAGPNGNLYFASIRPAGKEKEQVIVTKTGGDGRVIFKDRVIGSRSRLKSRAAGPIEVAAGSDSFAVIWPTPRVRNERYVRVLQQADAAGNLLGEPVELKDPGRGGLRIMMTEGKAVIGDLFAITGRRPRVLGVRTVTGNQLDELATSGRPLFSTLDATSNAFLITRTKDFIKPAAPGSYDPNHYSVGVADRHGTQLDGRISMTATDTARVELTDTDPDLIIHLYRSGRLIKTLNVGRGEDVALAATGRDLVAAWTGGPGWVDLKLRRWRVTWSN